MSVRAEVRLKPKREGSVLKGHPWIFSGALAEVPQDIAPGDIVDVLASSGRCLGVGHYNGGSIAVKLFSFRPANPNSDFWRAKLEKASAFRAEQGLWENSDLNAYRLVNGEADEFPGLIVDRYGDAAVIQFHSVGMLRISDLLASALASIFPELKTIYLKTSADAASEPSRFFMGNSESGVIKENGCLFKVDWASGQKTGFFLDQRENRKLVGALSEGKDLLNCFCYTGGFSIYALAAGAHHVTSLDSSTPALEILRQNLELNHLSERHTSICADCFGYLKEGGPAYDIVIVDPPAFAKHRTQEKSALRGYLELNRLAASKVKSGGKLATFSCSQVVSEASFEAAVRQSLEEDGRSFKIKERLEQARCHRKLNSFPEGSYLKGLIVELQ